MTVTGGTGNDTIVGTDNADKFTGGKGADSINVGSGSDNVVIASGDISTLTTASATAAQIAAAGDIITGLANSNGTGDKITIDDEGFTTDLANLTVNSIDSDNGGGGAIVNTSGMVMLHNASATAGAYDSSTGLIQTDFIEEALTLITTDGRGTNDADTSDGYFLLSGAADGGTSDLGIFKIDHANGSANIAASEVGVPWCLS